ncbi:MAG: hypothetical protein DRO11_04145 [Methanobacteriota archaeon]|nr:MAG: hypothetical protein DRO11_04145 [Euryarchaeota archaeon]
MGSIGDPRAVEALVEALHDSDPGVRSSSARALGSIGDPKAVQPLVEALKTESGTLKGEILLALSNYQDFSLLEPLAEALEDESPYIRRLAVFTLWSCCGPQAIPYLVKALEDGDSMVRYSAVSALESIGNQKTIKPLEKALDDPHSMVRTVAASALGKIGDEQVLPSLSKALEDSDAWVRKSALEAIERIKSKTGRKEIGYRVLIVDDTAFMRKVLKDILEKEGFSVVGEAENAKEAIEKYFELKPDVVTMDIILPGIGGLEATKMIVERDPDAKIIMVTALEQHPLVVDAIRAGAKDYIVKPFKPDQIVATIKRVLSGGS